MQRDAANWAGEGMGNEQAYVFEGRALDEAEKRAS